MSDVITDVPGVPHKPVPSSAHHASSPAGLQSFRHRFVSWWVEDLADDDVRGISNLDRADGVGLNVPRAEDQK